jgi:hypothetical protein
MALAIPKREGFKLSHKSGVFAINGEDVRGIKTISIEPTVEGREAVRDNGVIALGFTRGEAQVELSVTMDYGLFRDWMAGAGFTRGFLMRSGFTLSCTYEELGEVRNVTASGVTFTGLPTSSEGTAGMEIEVPGMALDVEMDGESIFDVEV